MANRQGILSRMFSMARECPQAKIAFRPDTDHRVGIAVLDDFGQLTSPAVGCPLAIFDAELLENFFLTVREKDSGDDQRPEIIALSRFVRSDMPLLGRKKLGLVHRRCSSAI